MSLSATSRPPFPYQAMLALLGAMLGLAIGTSFAKQLFPLIGAQGTTALRTGFSALLLVLIWRPWRWRLKRQDYWAIIRYGAMLGLMNLSFYMALRTIPFGIAVAIEFCGPLAVALHASRRPIDYLWIGCAVAGLALLLPWQQGAETHLDPIGVLYATGAAICWGGYIIYGKRATHLHTGQTVAIGVSVAALLVMPVGLAHAGTTLFSPQVLLIGLGVALLSSAIPMFLEMWALRRLAAGSYGVMTSLEPAVAAIVAMIILGEQLSWLQWGAILCTVTAAMGSALTTRTNH
ncbi:MAG: DMT family transporter [Lautropia sp.]|nr:DMT family transporter [Lautropia sp.]